MMTSQAAGVNGNRNRDLIFACFDAKIAAQNGRGGVASKRQIRYAPVYAGKLCGSIFGNLAKAIFSLMFPVDRQSEGSLRAWTLV